MSTTFADGEFAYELRTLYDYCRDYMAAESTEDHARLISCYCQYVIDGDAPKVARYTAVADFVHGDRIP